MYPVDKLYTSRCYTMSRRLFDLLPTLSLLLLIHPLQTSSVRGEVCRAPTSLQLHHKLDALLTAFNKGRSQTDLIILIDRSKSVNDETAGEMMTSLKALIDMLVNSSRLQIHPDFARIALLSYGATITAEFEGISSKARTFDACDVEERLASLRTQSVRETNTKVWQALRRAQQIFAARRDNLATNSAHKQVLWVFYDGNANEDDAGDSEKVKAAVGELAGAGVVVFSAAIGLTPTGWLVTPEDENRVRELAKDGDHFACVGTWTELLQNNTPARPENDVTPVYAHVQSHTGLTPEVCATCPLTCICDVIHRDYNCVACELLGNCHNMTSPYWSERVRSVQRDLLRQTWFVIVLAILVSVLFFLVSSVLVGLVCCYRNRHKKSPETPVLPLPPKKFQLRELHIMSDPVYSNTTLRQMRGVPDPVQESNWMEEEMDMTGQQQTVEEYQQNMPDWDHFLLTEAMHGSLHHLAVYSMEQNAGAWTPGFDLPTSHLKAMRKALKTSSQRKPTLKLGKHTFLLDTDSTPGVKLTGHSLNTGAECVHVCKVANFLVVGVASSHMSDSCQAKVAEICRHLEVQSGEQLPSGRGVVVEGGVVKRGVLQETL